MASRHDDKPMAKEEEYKALFLAEALENYEELNQFFVKLENDHADKEAVNAIFRITHTLKANAAAMGFTPISETAHLLEDIFGEIRQDKFQLTTTIFDDLFRANDKLGELIQAVQSGEKVRYQGIQTKLKVILRNAKGIQLQDDSVTTEILPQKDAENTPKNPTPQTALEIPESIDKQEDTNESIDKKQQPKITFSDLVQVPVEKLDNLLNLVGELAIEKDKLITQSQVSELADENDYAALYRITSDLQYSVMGVRLVQVSVLFNKFHRIIRDISVKEGKKVQLELQGTDVEIDRNILQIISDSLIHLVRNAISHGIEPADERQKIGKNPVGKVTLSARNDKDHVVIEVADDGRGIVADIIRKKALEKGFLTPQTAAQISDNEVINLIFEAGFSSAEKVTAVSGRGVGMDVVKRATDSVGGKVKITTAIGKGSKISMFLPASMAVKSVLLFISQNTEYAIPLIFTEAVINLKKSDIHKVGKGLAATYLNQTISVVWLSDLFTSECLENLYESKILHRGYEQLSDQDELFVIVISATNRLVGLVVDKLLHQKEIIEKPLSKPADKVPFISGVTILGNGNVCLVMDIPSVVNHLFAAGKISSISTNHTVLT